MSDPSEIYSPSHYQSKSSIMECIDCIQAALPPEQFKGYLRGAALKYLWRYEAKGGTQDLRKCHWYVTALIKANETAD